MDKLTSYQKELMIRRKQAIKNYGLEKVQATEAKFIQDYDGFTVTDVTGFPHHLYQEEVALFKQLADKETPLKLVHPVFELDNTREYLHFFGYKNNYSRNAPDIHFAIDITYHPDYTNRDKNEDNTEFRQRFVFLHRQEILDLLTKLGEPYLKDWV